MKDSHQPPEWIITILNKIIKPGLAEEIEGDLLEMYQYWKEEYGHKKAKWLYLLHSIKFIRPFALKSFTQSFKNTPMFGNHIKIARRQLIKNKSYALLNVSGLAIGLLVFTLISLWIHDEVTYNQYHKNYSRIARVMQNQTFTGRDTQTTPTQPLQLAPVLRTEFDDRFEHISMATYLSEYTIFFEEHAVVQKGIFMEASAPEMLSLQLIKGNKKALEDQHAILISESMAKSIFGDEDPMNRDLLINNSLEVNVKGVYENLPDNTEFHGMHFIASWELYTPQLPEWVGWGNNWFQTYVQLEENEDFSELSTAISDVKMRHTFEENRLQKPELFLHPMSEWHLYSDFKNGQVGGGRIQYVWLFGIVGVMVLALACINFMNLTTGRSENRAKEVGIRKAIGSSRGLLISQFFTESIAIALISFIIAILSAQMLLPLFNEVTDKNLSIPWLSPIFWATGLGITLLTGIIAGSYPALFLSSFKTIKVLKGSIAKRQGSVIPRKVLVVVQFTMSIALIIGTIIIFNQISFIKNRPLGYDTNNLISVPLKGPTLGNSFEIVRNDLLETGVIEEVSRSISIITNESVSNSGFDWPGKDPEMQEEFLTVKINHEYGKTIGWNVIEGRDFSRNLQTDEFGLVINKAAAKYMGLDDPVGEQIEWGSHGTYTVIGIIEDMMMKSPYEPAGPTLFFLQYKGPSEANMMNIKIKKGTKAGEALAAIEGVYKKHESKYPFDYYFVDELLDKKFKQEVRVGKLTGFFSILAILISCLGLYGMSSFVAEQRIKEIGIRKVLGASIPGLWNMLSRDMIILVIIAGIAASFLSYKIFANWLQQFEYRIDITIWTFVIANTIAVLIALSTISFHTIKAAMANPVKSLKAE